VQRKPELIQSNDTIGMGWNTYTKLPQNIPNGWKIYQMAVKLTKWPQNIPTFSIARPSKIYPKLGFLV
jgi:hypothetical protein